MFEYTVIPSEMVITCGNASYFKSALMREFQKRLGITPRYSTPWHPEGHALIERHLQTLQQVIVRLADEHKNNWTAYLGASLWAMRESISFTLGHAPFELVYGTTPAGPLTILRESWTGERDLPADLKADAAKYLENLRNKLSVAGELANEYGTQQQQRYVSTYNKRTRDKHFSIGEPCLILQKDSTASSMFAKWKGPAVVKAVKSPYSYIVEYNGSEYNLHANKLKKFHTSADEAECNSVLYVTPDVIDCVFDVCNCALIYEQDSDFGVIHVVEPDLFTGREPLPSVKLKPEALSHLTEKERADYLQILDKYPEVFSEKPGFCGIVDHEVPMIDSFRPKHMKAYKVPDKLKEEVGRQITELLVLGFIEPCNTTSQVSPLVCVLKPPDKEGKRNVRICIDY